MERVLKMYNAFETLSSDEMIPAEFDLTLSDWAEINEVAPKDCYRAHCEDCSLTLPESDCCEDGQFICPICGGFMDSDSEKEMEREMFLEYSRENKTVGFNYKDPEDQKYVAFVDKIN
jgi:hypothetical protein